MQMIFSAGRDSLDKEKRKEVIRITNMVIELCLIAGSQLSTAYKVGAEFASGLEREINKTQQGDKNNVPTNPSVR